MKTIYKITTSVLVYLCLLNVSTVNAQVCGSGGFLFPSGTFTPTGSFTAPTTCSFAGDYFLVNVVSGNTYTFSTCAADGSNITYDSQLELYNNATLAWIAYSDDACGVQSRIVWTATFTGVVQVTLRQYFCGTNSTCGTVMVQNSTVGGYNPCTTIFSSAPCGSNNTTSVASGSGAYTLGPFAPPGKEYIYTYTPAVSGNYTITQSVNTVGTYIDYFFKPTSGGCNNTGWTFIQDIFGTGTSFGSAALTAGVSYYIMLDPENTAGGTVTWNLNCPAGYNPCTTILASNPCNVTNTTSIASGAGAYALGPFLPPGKEYIYTYTPAITGNYTITQSVNTVGTYIDYFFKPTSGGCNNSGWTFIQDIFGTGTSFGSASMTAGVQYYIMLDPENTAGGTVTWKLNCPATGSPNDACGGALPIACGGTVTGNTTGNNTDATPCNSFSSPGVWYTISSPTAANITLSLCGSSYDTWISVYSGSCPSGFTCVGQNDDFCGLQSQFTFSATAFTTYYILVNGFSSNSGAFTLSATCAAAGPDPCTTIINIPACAVNQTVTLGATGSWNPASCGFATPGQEQVYSFTAATTGNYSINVTSTNSVDYIDYAWKPAGSGCSATGWNCIQDVFNAGTYGTLSWTAGTTYYILLDKENWTGTSPATHTFNVTCASTPPPNDDCSSVSPVTLTIGVPQTFTGTTVGATAGSDGAFTGFPTVWHAFTLPACATVTLDYCATSPAFADVWIDLATACPANAFIQATTWNQNCPGGGLNWTIVYSNLPAGTYWIPVLGSESGYVTPGPYSLTVNTVACAPPPTNDNCSGAIPVTCGSLTSGDNSSAADDVFPVCGSTFTGQYKGMWYSITLPTSGTITATTCTYASWDTYLRIFSGTCSALTCVDFNDDACSSLQSSITTAPLPAGTYYILVSSYGSGGFGAFQLSVNCALCAAPPSGGTVSGPTTGCTGNVVTYSVTGSSSIQWQSSTTGVSGPFTDISGQTSPTLNFTPASPGTYYIRNSASGAGCSPGFSNVITLNVLSGGGVLSTTATPSASACPGTTVNLTGNFTTGSASLTITVVPTNFYLDQTSWEVRNSANVVIFTSGFLNSGVTNTTTVTPAASDYPVTFSIENNGTFLDNYNTFSVVCNANSTIIYSGSLPTAPLTVTSGPLNCAGASGTLSSPSWSGPGGFSASTLVAPLSMTPTSGGVYTLSGISPTGCPVSSSVTITALPMPVPSASSSAPVCDGTSLSFFGDNFAAGQSSGNSYSWTGPLGYSAAGQFPSISGATLTNSGTYTVTVTNSFGCSETATTDVIINPNPILSVNTSGTIPASCIGATDGCLDIDASNGTPLYLYDYNGNSTLDGVYCGLGAGSYPITVIDANGCEGSISATVIEDDQVDPQITCPPDVTAFNTPGLCAGVATWTAPVGTDNCAGATTGQSGGLSSGSSFPVGITPISYTVTDLFTNTATCSFNVIIVDNENPSITCPPDVIINADNGFCYASGVALGNPTTGDNCSIQGTTNNAPSQFPVGATIVDWETQDLAGNKAQCQQFVIVIDNQNPTISGMPSNIVFTANPTDCTPSISWTAPTANDNCSIASFTSNYNPGDEFSEGTTTVTYTAVDINGLSVSASFTVTILTQPLVVTTASPAYQCGYNISCNGYNNGQAAATVTGGCLPYSYVWSNGTLSASATSLTAGTYTVTVTDGNGHVTMQTITLTEPPALATTLGPDQSYDFACSCANLVPTTSGGSTCQPYAYTWSTGATSSTITVCPSQTATYTVTVTDINGCVTADVISILKPALVGQLDRYVVLGTGTQNDQIGSNDYFYTGAVGHRLGTGTISLNNNGTVNTWLAGNNVIIGNNSAVGTLYRNTATIGNNAAVGTTITPVAIPLTSKVPCFPVFSGGANVNVPGGSTVTISPGTYNNITTGNNSILKLNAGVYNVNSISTGNGSSILPNGAATAKDLIIFVKTTMTTGNQATVHGSYYSQGAMNLGNGNNTSGVYRGAFFGKPVSTGNNLSFYLDSYCYSSLALCTSKFEGDNEIADAEAGMFNLFPNPTNGSITLQYTGETGHTINVAVLNMLGQVLYERVINEFSGETIQDFDLNTLDPGVYFMQLRNGNEFINEQFVIAR